MARLPYWNISYGILIDVVALPALFLLAYGLHGHWKRIREGKVRFRRDVTDVAGKMGPVYLKGLILKGILGSKLYRKLFTGIAHGLVFWGMAVLALGTALVFAGVLFKLPVFRGVFNRWVMSFFLDLAGIAVLAGLIFLLLRRLFPPERLITPRERPGFIWPVSLLGMVILTGFVIEGLRIAATGPDPHAFVGTFIAGLVPAGEGGAAAHAVLWWTHGVLSLAFIAYIPYSPMVHIFLVPVNTALADPGPGAKMDPIDFSVFDDENADELPTLGCASLADFSRKRLLDYAACLWCGRCAEVCPAATTEKPLSPKGVMVTLAEKLDNGDVADDTLIDAVGVDAIFACTTCTACLAACPAGINQPKTLLKFRQNLVMEQSRIPELMGKANTSLEQRQHPFFGTGAGPGDWREGLDVPLFESGRTEFLLWIGCAVTYEERSQKIARAMVKILDAAGVSYGIPAEARCTGDPARQMGNEFLFSELATANIEAFDEMGVKKIITLCPHCYNSFSRNYPPLGGQYEVIPHAVFINGLLGRGSLSLSRGTHTICYHDPCYLGRRNQCLDEPRNVVSAVGQLVEMPRNREDSFCCGGGGGNYWAEEEGTRINQARTREALDTGADAIATACPFCLLMLTDGAKKFTEEPKAFDLAELVARVLPETESP